MPKDATASAPAPITQPPPARVLLTVRQLAQQQPALTEGGIRWDIFNAKTNGLAKSGAILRRGRRITLDPAKYLAWMDSKQEGAA